MDLQALDDVQLQAVTEVTHCKQKRFDAFDESRRRRGPSAIELTNRHRILALTAWLDLFLRDPIDGANSLAVLQLQKRLDSGLRAMVESRVVAHLPAGDASKVIAVLARAKAWTSIRRLTRACLPVAIDAATKLATSHFREDEVSAAGIVDRLPSDISFDSAFETLAKTLLGCKAPDARVKTMRALARLGWRPVLHAARKALARKDSATTTIAVQVIAYIGTNSDAERLIRFAEAGEAPWKWVAAALDRLAPHKTLPVMRAALMKGDTSHRHEALTVLESRLFPAKLRGMLLNLLPSLTDDEFAEIVFQRLIRNSYLVEATADAVLRGKAPGVVKLAIDQLVEHRPDDLQRRLTVAVMRGGGIVPDHWTPTPQELPRFKPAGSMAVREAGGVAALEALGQLATREEAVGLMRAQFASPAPRMRAAALNWFASGHKEYVEVDDFLALARDVDASVVNAAMQLLEQYDDPRKEGELGSLMWRSYTETIPMLHHAGRLIAIRKASAVARQTMARISAVKDWVQEAGQRLLGVPVVVKIIREALGRTSRPKKNEKPTIEISDRPIAHLHPHGEDIVRALALHEFGHHLFDFSLPGQATRWGLVRKQGLFPLFNALLDERLERLLRQQSAECGPLLDRLLSYAFVQEPRRVSIEDYAAVVNRPVEEALEAVRRSELPGTVIPQLLGTGEIEVRDVDMLRIPGLLPPYTAFLLCLRCGIDASQQTDPRVTHALGMVPRHVKDLTHRELFALTRKIGKVLGGTRRNQDAQDAMDRMMSRYRWLHRLLNSLLRRLDDRGLPSVPGVPPKKGKSRDAREEPDVAPQRNENPDIDFRRLRLVWKKAEVNAASAPIALRPAVRRLRAALEQLAARDADEYAVRRGRRIDLAAVRQLPARPWDPDIMVGTQRQYGLDAYIGIVIDRSGSMQQDHRIENAKLFAKLVSQAAGALPGVAGHVSSFDGEEFTVWGDLRRNGIASLQADGDNNDAGALWQAVQLARQSHKRHRLIVMINDDEPSGSSVAAIRRVIGHATKDEIICAQVMVAEGDMTKSSFPHAVKVTNTSFLQAAEQFVHLLISLTAKWR